MKTLDEVIDSITKQSGLEIRDQRRPEKDRFWVDRDTYTDALHYLKEYRSEKQIWESDRKHYEDWMEQYKEARDKHQQAVKEMLKNPPLTWDELKQMEDQPVWIEWLKCDTWGYRDKGSWWLVGEVRTNDIIIAQYLDEAELCPEDLDVVWQAYRKEHTDAEEA